MWVYEYKCLYKHKYKSTKYERYAIMHCYVETTVETLCSSALLSSLQQKRGTSR